MAQATPDLTMIVPTYNEREGLAKLVDDLFRVSTTAGVALELVIVDDNSPDGTGKVADELTARHRMRVIHRSGKLGLGSAVAEGFQVTTAPVVGVMDADFSHPPALVPRMLAVFRALDADLVVASRYIPGGSTPNWPVKRRALSRLGCLLARPLSPIRDAASGFFLIRGDMARTTRIKAGGFKICLELVVRARPVRLVELPYRFEDRELGESKMSLREAAGYLVQLRDLYRQRLSAGRTPHAYRQLRLDDVAALTGDRRPESRHPGNATK